MKWVTRWCQACKRAGAVRRELVGPVCGYCGERAILTIPARSHMQARRDLALLRREIDRGNR